ncbi:hypothetical protein [Candidatus Alkanophaga liquidiphilum]
MSRDVSRRERFGNPVDETGDALKYRSRKNVHRGGCGGLGAAHASPTSTTKTSDAHGC